MATHANSTPAPRAQNVIPFPSRMTLDQERARLLAATERNLNRLRELKEILFPEDASALPLSGLVQAQPGVLLCKGGRDVQHGA